MITNAENERLTRVGAGTPAGELMRRYWHPVASCAELDGRASLSVRLLGEDLLLHRDRSGTVHLIGTRRYPVRECAGLVFAYLGPLPAPLLPRLEGFAVAPAIRMIGSATIGCNWLQIMENSVDPIHSEWLHGHLQEFIDEERGVRYAFSKRHRKIAFDETPYGIVKRRLQEGQAEDCDDWRVGHPIVFPTILALGNIGRAWRRYEYQIRVPIDDTHTRHLWHTTWVSVDDAVAVPEHLAATAHTFDVPLRDASGNYALDVTDGQDLMAWETQGAIADRTAEHLGTTDRGVILLRRMLERELTRVAAGDDPMGVERDPTSPPFVLPVERAKGHHADGAASVFRRRHWRHAPIADELVALFAATEDRAPVAAG